MTSSFFFNSKSAYSLIRKTLIFTFILRVFFLLSRSFQEVIGQHTWRQIDTLGVSMRYWLRFSTENETLSLKTLLPAVLQASDGNGILPMEFPILNLLFSPLWAFGPYWGKILIYLLFGGLMTWLTWLLSKKKHWLALSILLLPSMSYSADFFEKFLPDTLAMMLITLGCYSFVKNRLKGIIWITIALLMKPTSVVGLIFLFFFRKFRRNFLHYISALLVPLAITLIYYTKGLEFISAHTIDTPNIFYVSARNPFDSIMGIFKHPGFITDQILNRFFMMWGTFIFLLMILFKKKQLSYKMIGQIIIGMLLVFFTICALDGTHLLQHNYYFLSGAPFYCSVFYLLMRNTKKWVSIIGCIFIVFHAIELSAQHTGLKKYALYAEKMNECQDLIKRNTDFPWKSGHAFRSTDEPCPSIGLCFGEKQGSMKSNYGFYYHLEPSKIPVGCRIADETKNFTLVRCSI